MRYATMIIIKIMSFDIYLKICNNIVVAYTRYVRQPIRLRYSQYLISIG
nr:MAG TPA: hypothetical protein [Caudoviricetes sp.]